MKITDPYTRIARLYPALICLLPLVVCLYALFPEQFVKWKALVGVLVSMGALSLLAQLARDRGKKLEAGLFDDWGGMPSVAILRYSNNVVENLTKARCHNKLAELTGISAPTQEMEQQTPSEADKIYLAWSNYIRANTRDTNKFGLLFKENINYGFRRNVLGLKPICISFGLLSFIILITSYFIKYKQGLPWDWHPLPAVIIAAFYLLIMTFIVTPSWVKIPADAYGLRLFEAVEIFSKDKVSR